MHRNSYDRLLTERAKALKHLKGKSWITKKYWTERLFFVNNLIKIKEEENTKTHKHELERLKSI